MRYTVDVARDVIIPKSKHAEIIAAEIIIAGGIDTKPIRHVVLPTVNFDHETR